MLQVVIEPRPRDLGGFMVSRLLPSPLRRMVGPFIFFDHMGPVELARGIPRSMDVRPHPHIGLSTVTYVFEGEIMHRDSVGSAQPIRPAEVNWMTAGKGITHSERFERARLEGGKLDAIQTWVALPVEREESEPTFSHHAGAELPEFESRGARGRLLAGSAFGLAASVPVHSPLFYVHLTLSAGTRAELPREYPERAVYIASGALEVDGRRLEAGQMLIFAAGGVPALHATTTTQLIAFGGDPVGARFIEWNFVSSSKERIDQAKADWSAGRMKLPDGDADEFIPLPSEPRAPPNPMS
jgi:redox-sensitive bicupin YhaK (pirin superfamily)